MRLKFNVALATITAALMLAAMVAPAMAALSPQTVALQLGEEAGTGYYASYGQQVDLLPTSLSSIELPGDVFAFEAFVTDSDGVQKWLPIMDFESLTLENTNTVAPFSFRFGYEGTVSLSDYSNVALTYPAQIRVEYKPFDILTKKSESTTPTKTYTETETLNVVRNLSEKVSIYTVGTIKHAGTQFHFHVSPNAGVGTIRVTVSKSGSKTLTYNVLTNADGAATQTLKLGTAHGNYKISAKFLGSVWGVASGTAVKTVHANR
jgi:hypothetical protein